MKTKKYENKYELMDIVYENGEVETFVINAGRIDYYCGLIPETCSRWENEFLCEENKFGDE